MRVPARQGRDARSISAFRNRIHLNLVRSTWVYAVPPARDDGGQTTCADDTKPTRRQERTERTDPEAAGFLARCMESGHARSGKCEEKALRRSSENENTNMLASWAGGVDAVTEVMAIRGEGPRFVVAAVPFANSGSF